MSHIAAVLDQVVHVEDVGAREVLATLGLPLGLLLRTPCTAASAFSLWLQRFNVRYHETQQSDDVI